MNPISLNQGWTFTWLGEDAPGDFSPDLPGENSAVSLPHTFTADGEPRRGAGVYRRRVETEPGTKAAYLSFDAVDQRCRVLIDGREAGRHEGGYSRFRIRVPEEALEAGGFDLLLCVDNRLCPHVSPLTGDFTVFGGIYRPVTLIACEEIHFDRQFFGTDGLILRPELEDNGDGLLYAEPHTVGAENAVIAYRVLDAGNRPVLEETHSASETAVLRIPSAKRWDGKASPALYTVEAALCSDGREWDRLTLQTGFRRAEATPEGFLLNGQPYPLWGVAKHQDRAGSLTAEPPVEIAEDFDLIGEIGARAVRLSHYQHPQAAYGECDRRGLLCWAEIPMLKMTEDPLLLANAKNQLTELILQNIHHPSIFCWGIQNEIAMFRDAPFMHKACRELHSLAKELDPSRMTACANLYPVAPESELNGITDMVGYNWYFGWYYGKWPEYGTYLDAFRAARPNVPVGISEYGADANPLLHSAEPKVKDYSEEYQALFHERVYPFLRERPWLWGSFVWNMFDFSSGLRDEGGVRGLNGKGLVSWDRTLRKDAFYYYKAQWSGEPFLHLCGKRYAERAGERTAVKVYTNCPRVRLVVNGEEFGEAPNDGNGTVVFPDVPLRRGENRLTAEYESLSDEMTITGVEKEPESYRLADAGEGPVTNWFLREELKEDHFSVLLTAQQILDDERACAVLRETFPQLYRLLAVDFVIPQGIIMEGILDRFEKDPDIRARFNRALQEIPMNKA